MAKGEVNKRILAEYKKQRSIYKDLAFKLEQLLDELLRNRGIIVHSINGRAKSRKSLSGKLNKNENKYKSLTELTDLAGIRIITYFSDDVDTIAKVIEQEFNVDTKNSVDKRSSLAVDRFGYLSMHQVVSLNDDRSALSENKAFTGLKAELQIRSILQHAWAEIEHDLGYKSAVGVPQPVQRRFARVASLLELADDEFKGIRKELEDYRETLPQDVKEKPDDVLLNLDSLQTIVSNDLLVRKIDKEISHLAGLKLGKHNGSLDAYLSKLERLGFKTIGQLLSSLAKNEALILLFVKKWLDTDSWHEAKEDLADVPLGISLFYLRLVEASLKQREEASDIYGEHTNPERTVDHLLSIAEEARRELHPKNK